MAYHLEEMPEEEGDKLTAELQAVLAKYNAEMGVTSNINLMKRVETPESTLSPIQPDGSDENKETKAD